MNRKSRPMNGVGIGRWGGWLRVGTLRLRVLARGVGRGSGEAKSVSDIGF